MRDGFAGIERSFISLLERNGIRKEDPTGAPFDPNLHQAMSEQESASHPPGTVLQSWTPGWTLNGRLLRPAMVVVSKAPGPRGEPIARDVAGPHRLSRCCTCSNYVHASPCRAGGALIHPHDITL